MARIAEQAILHEIKRSLRPDWRRFWKAGHENDRLYKLYERAERKFDPNQPRVPKGQPEGGQWTSDGEGDSQPVPLVPPRSQPDGDAVGVSAILAKAKQLAASGTTPYQRCLNLCFPILERALPFPGSDRNTFDFHKCMNACLGK